MHTREDYKILGDQLAHTILGADDKNKKLDQAKQGIQAGTGLVSNILDLARQSSDSPPSSSDQPKPAAGEPFSFTKKYAGIPVWGWGLGTAGLLTGLILLLKRK